MKETESSLKSHAESIGNGFTTSEVETQFAGLQTEKSSLHLL